MSKTITVILGALLSFSALAQDLSVSGFNNRFKLVRNDQGKVTVIKLKKATTRFSIMPFIEQLKDDLSFEQHALMGMSDSQREAEIDQMLIDAGLNPYAFEFEEGSEEARRYKEAMMNIVNIDVESSFAELNAQNDFWAEFEAKLNEAMLFIDPTVLANLDDSRFFYKKAVTYKVVIWALEQAKKKFANVPILNIASFVIVRIHDMMLEQRHFHHNMLLHYFENVKESDLGMSKEEVDRTVSSIYEYRIEATDIFTSNRAAADWMNFGIDRFYTMVRAGNNTVRTWQSPLSSMELKEVKKVNFAFAEATDAKSRKIFHLHHKMHQFTSKPALAYDYAKPTYVKRMRSLLNIGGVALGFIKIPGWLKSNVDNFMKSFYVQQVRTEGALVGYFESTGNASMSHSIYAQRANFYILE